MSVLREARASDFDAITRIRASLMIDPERMSDSEYRVHLQAQGFLLPLQKIQQRAAFFRWQMNAGPAGKRYEEPPLLPTVACLVA